MALYVTRDSSRAPASEPEPSGSRFLYSRHRSTAPESGVDDLWVLQADRCRTAVEAVLADTAAEIYFNLGPTGRWVFDEPTVADRQPLSPRAAWVVGPRAETLLIEKSTLHCDVVGVRLRPGVAAQVLGVPAMELRGGLVDLDLLWGSAVVEEIRDRLSITPEPEARAAIVEQAILARLSRRGAHAAVRRIDTFCAAMRALASPTIRGLADALGLTHRQVIAVFDRDVGLKPKVFQRVERLRRVMQTIGRETQPTWSRLATQAGYFDQAHLIHEFRKLAGMTPGEYAASRMQVGDGVVPYRLATTTSSMALTSAATSFPDQA